MSIEKFKSQFADLLRPNYFEVLINPPNTLNASNEILSFMCNATDFPFETINTMELITHSKKRMIASGVDFDPITMTFLLDSTGLTLDFFEKWKQLVIDKNFKMNYYENYIGSVEIYMLDRQKRRIAGVKLLEAYPVNRNNIALSYASTDTLSELSVSFVYAALEPSMNNVEYPNGESFKQTKVYTEGNGSPLSNDSGIKQVNDYLGKFGTGIEKTVGNFNQLTGGYLDKINNVNNKIGSTVKNISSTFTKVQSSYSNISKTIKNLFSF